MERRWMLSLLMIIGIVGYFCVPTVANYIIHAGGGNSILTRVNSMAMSALSDGMQSNNKNSANTAGAAKSGAGMIVDRFDDARRNLSQGMAEASGQDYFKDKLSGK